MGSLIKDIKVSHLPSDGQTWTKSVSVFFTKLTDWQTSEAPDKKQAGAGAARVSSSCDLLTVDSVRYRPLEYAADVALIWPTDPSRTAHKNAPEAGFRIITIIVIIIISEVRNFGSIWICTACN